MLGILLLLLYWAAHSLFTIFFVGSLLSCLRCIHKLVHAFSITWHHNTIRWLLYDSVFAQVNLINIQNIRLQYLKYRNLIVVKCIGLIGNWGFLGLLIFFVNCISSCISTRHLIWRKIKNIGVILSLAFGECLFRALNIFPIASMPHRDPITSGNKTICESLNPPVCCDGYVNIASG